MPMSAAEMRDGIESVIGLIMANSAVALLHYVNHKVHSRSSGCVIYLYTRVATRLRDKWAITRSIMRTRFTPINLLVSQEHSRNIYIDIIAMPMRGLDIRQILVSRSALRDFGSEQYKNIAARFDILLTRIARELTMHVLSENPVASLITLFDFMLLRFKYIPFHFLLTNRRINLLLTHFIFYLLNRFSKNLRIYISVALHRASRR